MQSDILEYIAGQTGASIGQLPEDGGMVVQLAPSPSGASYLNRASSDNLSLLFLSKNSNQHSALSEIESVCNMLTCSNVNAHGIYSISVATQPNYVGREGDYWIYSCVVDLKFYHTEVS